MRWLIAQYQPVGLFSLKIGEATSTGGKSLIIPTPFAIRTALLDAAIRVQGVNCGPQTFNSIKTLHLAVRPPKRAAVTSLFAKVLKPERDADGRGRAMQKTISFREYVYLEGTLTLAFGGEQVHLNQVSPLLPHLTYLGKRGSFFQLLAPPAAVETADDAPPEGFVPLVAWNQATGTKTGPLTFPLGHVQRLDEWGADLTYEKANIYTSERIKIGRDRIRMDVVLPYRLVQAGRGFIIYECV